MKPIHILFLICSATLLQSSSAYFVLLNKTYKVFCFAINEQVIGGKKFNLRYNYTGQDTQNIKSKIVEINDANKRKVLYTQMPNKDKTNYTYEHEINESYEYEVCFESFDLTPKIVSFQYDNFLHSGHVDNEDMKASKEYLDKLQSSVFELYGDINEVRANEWAHAAILSENKDIAKWGSIAKIGL